MAGSRPSPRWRPRTIPTLVVVVVAAGARGSDGPGGAVFPDAFVRRLDEPLCFGTAANEVLGVVEGAGFFLICHDDCAADPSAVRAPGRGVVPFQRRRRHAEGGAWDDPLILLHVGMNADKTGAMVDRVSERRDRPRPARRRPRRVRRPRAGARSCAPTSSPSSAAIDTGDRRHGRPTSTSAGGPRWRAPGSWCAPRHVVRHLEVVAAGVRPALAADGSVVPSDQALLRRHELRTVLKCYGTFHLLRVAAPDRGARTWARSWSPSAARDRPRARAVWDAWRWNLATPRRAARGPPARAAAAARSTTRRSGANQRSGSARLAAYLSNVAHLGVDVTHRQMSALAGTVAVEAEAPAPELTGSVGGAFSEDADFDEARRPRPPQPRRPARPRILASRRSRLTAMIMVATPPRAR